jgi:hypothetical protein
MVHGKQRQSGNVVAEATDSYDVEWKMWMLKTTSKRKLYDDTSKERGWDI